MPTHAEKRFLPYTPEQMFALVADIESYPQFLPWCVGTRIRSRTQEADGRELVLADMIIGYKMFRERFTSRVRLKPHARIDVEYSEGPFRYLTNHWTFVTSPGGTTIDFFVDEARDPTAVRIGARRERPRGLPARLEVRGGDPSWLQRFGF